MRLSEPCFGPDVKMPSLRLAVCRQTTTAWTGTIPRRELPRVLKGIAALSEQSGLDVANVFHAGDGNMHPLILFDANKEGQLALAEDVGGKILELCVEAGGSITGEHGVGRENQSDVQPVPGR